LILYEKRSLLEVTYNDISSVPSLLLLLLLLLFLD
jgi:hypothetical protein